LYRGVVDLGKDDFVTRVVQEAGDETTTYMSSKVSITSHAIQDLASHTNVTSTEVHGLLGSIPLYHFGGYMDFVLR
jgi:hypothetical protein